MNSNTAESGYPGHAVLMPSLLPPYFYCVTFRQKKLHVARGCDAPPRDVNTNKDFKNAHNNGEVDGMIS
jgi:hypothetical protein